MFDNDQSIRRSSSLTLDLAPEVDGALVDIGLELHAGQVELAALFEVNRDSVDLHVLQVGA